MKVLELYHALGELLVADPAAGERQVEVHDASTYRDFTVLAIAPPVELPVERVVLEVEHFAEAPCACGGTITYLPDRPKGAGQELCDSCDEPTPVEV